MERPERAIKEWKCGSDFTKWPDSHPYWLVDYIEHLEAAQPYGLSYVDELQGEITRLNAELEAAPRETTRSAIGPGWEWWNEVQWVSWSHVPKGGLFATILARLAPQPVERDIASELQTVLWQNGVVHGAAVAVANALVERFDVTPKADS